MGMEPLLRLGDLHHSEPPVYTMPWVIVTPLLPLSRLIPKAKPVPLEIGDGDSEVFVRLA